MEFITVEQFQKQPKEVQKVFLDWWQPQEFDIYAYKEDLKPRRVTETDIEDVYNNEVYNVKSGFAIPLFTEGQLREFIEDKLEQIHYENDGRRIELDITHNNNFTRIEEGVIGSNKGIKRVEWTIENEFGKKYDLLQVYWQVACQIAKELL